jgi:hypothetical protein
VQVQRLAEGASILGREAGVAEPTEDNGARRRDQEEGATHEHALVSVVLCDRSVLGVRRIFIT